MLAGGAGGVDEEEEADDEEVADKEVADKEVADEEAEEVALGDAVVMGFCAGPELMVRSTAAPRTAWVPARGF